MRSRASRAVPDSAVISVARTHLAACPVSDTTTASGSRSSHSAIANSQRGRKEQPAGRLPGRGGEPAMPSSWWDSSRDGMARMSPRV